MSLNSIWFKLCIIWWTIIGIRKCNKSFRGAYYCYRHPWHFGNHEAFDGSPWDIVEWRKDTTNKKQLPNKEFHI